MAETNFCLRVDIDTWMGLKKGIPACIELSEKHSIPITYYLSLGKYATGRNIFRLVKNREKIVKGRIPPWKRNHWKDLLHGIILPSKKIKQLTIPLLRDYENNKFVEFHAHGYNHVNWSNNFASFDEDKTTYYLDSSISSYQEVFGKNPIANASPNFVTNSHYLELLEKKQFKFAADFRHHSPFFSYTEKNGKKITSSVLQLPVTEPTLEELVIQGKSHDKIVNTYEQRFQKYSETNIGYVCLYVHAVFEPLRLGSLIEEIIDLAYRYDMNPTSHTSYYMKHKSSEEFNE